MFLLCCCCCCHCLLCLSKLQTLDVILKKQKSHHPGRSQHPFPLVNHSIFSECDHRRRPTSICSRTRLRQTQEQIPRGPRAWPFSKDTLLGCGALAVLSVLGATSALSVPPPPPLPFPPRALIPTRLRLGSASLESCQHAAWEGTFMMKPLSVTCHSFRSVGGWVGESELPIPFERLALTDKTMEGAVVWKRRQRFLCEAQEF